MDTNQVVQALVDPKNGVIVKLIDRQGKLEGERAVIAETVSEQSKTMNKLTELFNDLSATVNTLMSGQNVTEQRIAALEQRLDEIAGQLGDLIQSINAPAPKRTRKKKEPQPEEVKEEVPQVEVEVVDPEAPTYEPGLVPDEVAGVKLTGPVVMSIRNNIKVLTLALAKQLNTEYPSELYDFVAGLTDDEARAIAEKFPE